jgi:4-oxalocrotonate tautomerase
MPVVIVEMWVGRTVEQKRALAKAITKAMVEHAGARPEHLHVIIHEIPKENWARAGVLAVDREEKAPSDASYAVIGLSHLLLQVKDLKSAEAFYVDLLGFTRREHTTLRDGRPLLSLEEGLGLTTYHPGGDPGARNVDHIAFRISGLDPLLDRLNKAQCSYEGPVVSTRYGTSVYVRDPDGNRIEFHDR